MTVPGFRVSIVLALSLAVVGCDGGFSDEEAQQRCDQELQARGSGQNSCMTEQAYDECIAAYTECGSDVRIAETCPSTFVCTDGGNCSRTSAPPSLAF